MFKKTKESKTFQKKGVLKNQNEFHFSKQEEKDHCDQQYNLFSS